MKGFELLALRKKLRLNQQELGDLLSVSKRTIVNYEKSEELSPRVASYIDFMLNKEGLSVEAKEEEKVIRMKHAMSEDSLDRVLIKGGSQERETLDQKIERIVNQKDQRNQERIFALFERIMSLADDVKRLEAFHQDKKDVS